MFTKREYPTNERLNTLIRCNDYNINHLRNIEAAMNETGLEWHYVYGCLNGLTMNKCTDLLEKGYMRHNLNRARGRARVLGVDLYPH